jgi:hypothetical protein
MVAKKKAAACSNKKPTKRKKRINSRDKGAVGERELAGEFNRLFGTNARRGQQFSGLEGEDVVGLDGIHVESKRVENLNVHKAITQAIRDSKELKVPAVFHRKNHTPWLVTVRLNDVIKFAECIQNLVNCPNKAPAVKAANKAKPAEVYDYK